jgi:membrane associated rhomboid family serine protease
MNEDPHPDWIDTIVKLGAWLGMNPTRLRWKLIRWHEHRRRDRRRVEQQVEHIRYAHKTCRECGAVQDRDEATCTSCGAKLGSRGFEVLRRLGFAMPQAISLSTVLALAIMAVYVRVFVAQGGGFGAPSAGLLVDFGAQWEMGAPDRWRLLTAIFLHIGMWHLAFNLIAIATIGPQVEAIYDRTTMLFVFIATGVAANLGSGAMQPMVISAGASGGVCGLIGAAVGYGHRLDTTRGRTIRNDMLKWLAYTIVFGFAIGANNWAHAFGALAGAAFGFFVPPEIWKRRALAPVRALAKLAGIAGMIAAIAIVFTRNPSAHGEVNLIEVYDRTSAAVCRAVDVDELGVAHALDQERETWFDMESADDATLRDECRTMRLQLDMCREPSAEKSEGGVCERLERVQAELR